MELNEVAVIVKSWPYYVQTDGLVQDRTNSCALAMELLQSCSKLSKLNYILQSDFYREAWYLSEPMNLAYFKSTW